MASKAIMVLLAAIALLVGYASWQSHRAAGAMEKLDAVTNRLDALQVGVDASNKAILAMDAKMLAVTKKATVVRERVIQMERNDATVKAFLDIPVPVDGCMLDDTCATGIPKPSPAAPMRPASATGQ